MYLISIKENILLFWWAVGGKDNFLRAIWHIPGKILIMFSIQLGALQKNKYKSLEA